MGAHGLTMTAVDVGALGEASFSERDSLGQRVRDIVLSALLLLLFAPLFAALSLTIWLEDGGSVFYGQRRVGKDGVEFRCWKFRSMVADSDNRLRELLDTSPSAREEWELYHKLRQDPRITRLGRILRTSSLDELPQLWNVFVGEMSLVGPRPIVAAEVRRYARRYSYYCSCRPGITGLWQVSGRNDVNYRRRVALDTLYAQRRCLILDVKIMIKTVPAVLMRRGCY